MAVAPPPKILLTGVPGCGKTTAIQAVLRRLEGRVHAIGFVTEEVLEDGRRRGFRGSTLDGRSFILADRDSSSELRVGPYGVELAELERIGLDALVPRDDTDLVVLDEIGKMEGFSEMFRLRVEELLGGALPLLGTVAGHGVGFVKRVRRDPRVTLMRLRRGGRDGAVGQVLRHLRDAGIGTARVGGEPRASGEA